MEIIGRKVGKLLQSAFEKYPIVTVTGPRQSGKSTLVQSLFPGLSYVNLESQATQLLAKQDPVGFCARYKAGAIFDEVQNVPELFPELQVVTDRAAKNSLFVLSGSQNFLLMEGISQSLAGRSAIFKLYPFTQEELQQHRKQELEERIFYGGFPRIFKEDLDPSDWLDNYTQTFVERDIRSLRNIANLAQFRLFLRMCAARSGQLLDLVGLGNDCGVSSNTAKAWISLLETSFVVFRLPPYFRNFNKRLIKSPKLYFWDTGLLCYLLGLRTASEIATHPQRGAIFETYVLSELAKYINNTGRRNEMFFWRDKVSEVDCLVELSSSEKLILEVKSGATYTSDYLKGIDYYSKLDCEQALRRFVVYAGQEEQILHKDIHLCGEEHLLANLEQLFA